MCHKHADPVRILKWRWILLHLPWWLCCCYISHSIPLSISQSREHLVTLPTQQMFKQVCFCSVHTHPSKACDGQFVEERQSYAAVSCRCCDGVSISEKLLIFCHCSFRRQSPSCWLNSNSNICSRSQQNQKHLCCLLSGSLVFKVLKNVFTLVNTLWCSIILQSLVSSYTGASVPVSHTLSTVLKLRWRSRKLNILH